jgi:hypothetical protein
MYPTTPSPAVETVIAQLTSQLTTLTRTLATWMQESPRTLGDAEQRILTEMRLFAAQWLTSLLSLVMPAQPDRTVPCPCGRLAHYQRMREAQMTTLVGVVRIPRASYVCPDCHQGQAPADATLQLCPGSRSAGLDELLALLGATQDSFQEAATVLERLTGVQTCANTVRDATETLGTVVAQEHVRRAARAQTVDTLPATALAPAPRIARLYLSMESKPTCAVAAGAK